MRVLQGIIGTLSGCIGFVLTRTSIRVLTGVSIGVRV